MKTADTRFPLLSAAFGSRVFAALLAGGIREVANQILVGGTEQVGKFEATFGPQYRAPASVLDTQL